MIIGGDLSADWEFFISYTQADRAWAEWIAWNLEEDGHKVLIQAWDFVPGSNWIQRMQDGTAQAARTIAVLSAAYLKSHYGTAEWRAAWAEDPSGAERKLLIAQVGACERPGLLGGVVSVELSGLDEHTARARLREMVMGAVTGRAKPATPPSFPGHERAVLNQPEFPGDPPRSENLPTRGPAHHYPGAMPLAARKITVLHVSDPQFGEHHLFGGNGLTSADQARDTLFQSLHDDLANLIREHGLRPDLIVATGDLSETGAPDELGQAMDFLMSLATACGLPHRRVVIVPGNHDVNRLTCEAYFLEMRARRRPPLQPYWRKWEHFAAAFDGFYTGVQGVSFTPDEPWTLFEVPDLQVVVAGLNSTIAESHLDDDHYGWVGGHQLRWFADRMAAYRRQGWLRLGAVHHNAVRGAVLDEENLRDTDDLHHWLGEPMLNLLLHGHAHDAGLHRLPSGLIALSTGSAAVKPEARRQEVPNRYQLITIRADGFTRYARQYAPRRRRWIAEPRSSRTGWGWQDAEDHAFADVAGCLGTDNTGRPHRLRPAATDEPQLRESAFMTWVREAAEHKYPQATITVVPAKDYLRVRQPLPTSGFDHWPVGVTEVLTGEYIESFAQGAHAQFAAADSQVQSELVYAGPPASAELTELARSRGIRLHSFTEYQGLLDLRPLAARQAEQVAADRRYPAELYIDQRYRMFDAGPDAVSDGLLEEVIGWLGTDGARLVVALGDFGRGKTFLLRQLVRVLPDRLPGLLPVLVELRSLEKAPSLDELLAQHLVRNGVDTELSKLRYMVRSGRFALFFDGFDELALRITYDHAADYLQTLLGAVTGRAKIVLTSRTQYFGSDAQVRTALGARVTSMAGSRVAVIEDFSDAQIRQFLINHYRGDEDAALGRYELIRDIKDLLGLSHNPRMLSFIADLDEQRLREIQAEHGQISAAELYRELVDFWLIGEAKRQRHRGGLPTLDEQERLTACTALAVRLWTSLSPTIPHSDLSAQVAATLTQVAKQGYSADEAAHTVGSGSLLVRTEDGAFTFVHQSVMEWLVASAAAEQLRDQQDSDLPAARTMSALMADFLCDLAGHDLASNWAERMLVTAEASQAGKQNALAITARVGRARPETFIARIDLRGADLRGQDLTGRDLRGADLREALLRDMRLDGTDLAGADLRGADLRGARLTNVILTGAELAGIHLEGAALLRVGGLDTISHAPELRVAAICGRDRAEPMIQPGGPVTCAAISADGTVLALGRDNLIELRDLGTGSLLRILRGHAAPVSAVAWSPDGTRLATASDDRTARIWHAATGRTATTLAGHNRVAAVAWSPDGTRLATASDDRTARIWDTANGQLAGTIGNHHGTVNAVAWSPDGTHLATASSDRTARIWDTVTGHTAAILVGHHDTVNAVAYSPDGAHLATASDDRTAGIWDTATGQPVATLTVRYGTVNAVAWSPDGAHLATASNDRTARIWDTATGRTVATLTGHDRTVNAVAYSPDGAHLATASDDRTARIWDIGTGRTVATLTGHDRTVSAVAYSPDGAHLATASNDATARIWDTATGQPAATLTGRYVDPVLAVAYSPDGAHLATASADCTTRIWDTATGQLAATLTGHHGAVWAVAYSPSGTRLATTSADRTARIWDTATGRTVATLTGHTDWVRGVAYSPDGTRLATASTDQTARIWDTTTGGRVATLNGHDGTVWAVAYSPDSTRLATASADRTARIWDTATRRTIATLEGHDRTVNAVAYSPDGTRLATASTDQTARIWDTATGRPVATLNGHDGTVWAVAYSPDGTRLATASTDGTARIWDSATSERLCTLITLRNGGYAVLLPDGTYKLDGDASGILWWVIKLCRFEPGELDPYDDNVTRLPDGATIGSLSRAEAAPER